MQQFPIGLGAPTPRLAKTLPLPPGVVAEPVWGPKKWASPEGEIEADRLRLRWWLESTLPLPGRRDGEVAFCGMNPSSADGTGKDLTLGRWWGFATAWGYQRQAVYNLSSARGTDPEWLLSYAGDPDNVRYVGEEARRIVLEGGTFIASWGDLPSGQRRDGTKMDPAARRALRELLTELQVRMLEALRASAVPVYVLALTANGSRPRHPLMLRSSGVLPTLWRAP